MDDDGRFGDGSRPDDAGPRSTAYDPARKRSDVFLADIMRGGFQDESAFHRRVLALQVEVAAQILNVCGDRANCRACGDPIFWMVSKNGKKVPYSLAGHAHWADCPNAEEFRRKQAGGAG